MVQLRLRLLHLAQTAVQFYVEVLLPPLQVISAVQQDLVLSAHTRELLAQVVDGRGEIDNGALVLHRHFDARQPIVKSLLVRLDLAAQRCNAAARLVVVEQALRRGARGHEQPAGAISGARILSELASIQDIAAPVLSQAGFRRTVQRGFS